MDREELKDFLNALKGIVYTKEQHDGRRLAEERILAEFDGLTEELEGILKHLEVKEALFEEERAKAEALERICEPVSNADVIILRDCANALKEFTEGSSYYNGLISQTIHKLCDYIATDESSRLASDPKFLSAMKRIVEGMENSTLDLDKVESADFPISDYLDSTSSGQAQQKPKDEERLREILEKSDIVCIEIEDMNHSSHDRLRADLLEWHKEFKLR